MERKRYLITALIDIVNVPSYGQVNKTVYQVYIIIDIARCKNAIDSFESVSIKNKLHKEI